MKDSMNIICASDDNYAQHMGVMLVSLLENNKRNDSSIFIVDGNISDKNKKALRKVSTKYDRPFTFLKPDFTLFKDVLTDSHITEAAYYRLSVAELLPSNIERVLYLDSDLIVCGDISL